MKELVDTRSGTQGAADHVYLEPLDEHELTQWKVFLTPEKGSLFEGARFEVAVTIGDRLVALTPPPGSLTRMNVEP